MEKIDLALYQQMGFSESIVKEAIQYSKKHKVDIFDALQIIQKQDSPNQKTNSNQVQNKKQSSAKTNSSILIPMKKFNLLDYQVIFSKKSSRMASNTRKIDIRQSQCPVGLYNVSNCCYLNSLLQCYFLMPDFMKYIYEGEPLNNLSQLETAQSKIKIKRIKNQYNLLLTLKDIFSKMALSSKKHLDPTEVLKNLVDSVGEKIEYGEEKDLFEINTSIIERLNQCLLYTKKYYKGSAKQESESPTKKNQLIDLHQSTGSKLINKSKVRQIDNIKRLFYGKKIQYTETNNQSEQQSEILSDFLGIIINPSHGNFYKALDQQFHYDVEIQGESQNKKRKIKKHTYIKEVPQYMFFYINRTSYNAQQKQPLKNEEKMSFDFIIYLDRYLEKYRKQQALKNPVISQLLSKKNKILKEKNQFELLAKKIQECYQYAEFVDGWKNKLPAQDQLNNQKQTFEKQVKQIEKELEKVQSRRQKYYLMYIFVHRGDAISGHYWGYGRNNHQWYRFDINCTSIKEEQILVDLYKSGGTPYALVYVQENQLPNFKYDYYHNFQLVKENQLLIDVQSTKSILKSQVQLKADYFKYIPFGLKKVIISQNIRLYQDFCKRKNIEIMQKTVQQYKTRYNLIKSQINSFIQKQDKLFKNIPPYSHFSMYLMFIGEKQLAKYNIFATSLLISSNKKTKQLIQDQPLLNLIQKQFRKKVKGQLLLKHFAIQCEPKQYQKYKNLYQAFYYEKESLKLSFKIIKLIQDCQKQEKNVVQNNLAFILQVYTELKKKLKNNQSYVIHLLQELIFVCLIKMCILNIKINITQMDADIIIPSLLKQQLEILSNQKLFLKQSAMVKKEVQFKFNFEKNITCWSIQEITNFQNKSIDKKFKQILSKIKLETTILKKLQKEKQLVKIDQNGKLKQIIVEKKQLVNDLLI